MQNVKSVLVVGATGFLGSEICRQLTAMGKKVRALVRSTSDPSKIKSLQDLGIETVVGNIRDRSSLDAAMEGAGAVISTVSSTLSRIEGDSIETVDRQGQLNVVNAANDAGVDHFIYISFLESPESFPLQDAKREVENKIMSSKMTYTILRPTFFMEVWLSSHLGFDVGNHKATIYGQGANKISFIAIKDVAAFATASLDNSAAQNSIIDLGGPKALSPLEVVKIFEEQTGRDFQLQYVPEEALRMQRESAEDPLQQSFTGLMLTYAEGAEVPMVDTLRIFPMQLHSVNEFSRQFVTHEEAV